MSRYAISKRRRRIITALCILIGMVFICLDRCFSPLRRQRHQKTGNQAQLITCDFQKYHQKKFTVVKVVDGDTIDIDIPDGNFVNTRIRLWGIDTPETKGEKSGIMYFGRQAADFTKNLVLDKQICVYLEKHRTRGKYGRLLAYIRLPDDSFLNEVLLSEGFAYADLRFRHSFYNKYRQLEAVARSQKKGLWKKVNRRQLPQWLQRNKPNLLKNRTK